MTRDGKLEIHEVSLRRDGDLSVPSPGAPEQV
jgi:hypothetical protein